MTKHTVLIAVTVDDKYTANEVAHEVAHFLPYITSECLDTVDMVIAARIKRAKQPVRVISLTSADALRKAFKAVNMLAEAADTVDVEHETPMLYQAQVQAILRTLDEDLHNG